MALYINSNAASTNASRNVSKSSESLNSTMSHLASGMRINSAKDDAAGMGIASRMTSQIRGTDQAARNSNDAISATQTAEGALTQSSNILQRIREVAVQAANDTNSADDRKSLQAEVTQLQSELDDISRDTSFNGKKLLDGTFIAAKFQTGANANQSISFSIASARTTDIGNYRLAADGDMSTAVSDSSAVAANTVTAQTLTVTGAIGNADVGIDVGASAGEIAAAVNAAAGTTGVSATGVTSANVAGVGAGNLSFDLKGKNATAITISATVVSSSDLSGLAEKINGVSAQTGITAVADGSGGMKLESLGGDDIQIESFTTDSSDTDFTLTGDGGAAATVDGTNNFARVAGQVTFNSSAAYSVTSDDLTGGVLTAASTGTLDTVAAIDISSQQGAVDALAVIDGALNKLNKQRGDLGAVQNRFASKIENLQTTSENLKSARGRIEDADFASETAKLARDQVMSQAGVAMLGQANQQGQQVLALLRG